MVVDHIELHGEAKVVCPIDQSPEIVGVAVCPRRGKEAHAVVSPISCAGKIGDRHDLNDCDADIAKQLEFPRRGRERSLGRECANVQFVQNPITRRAATPPIIGPGERRWIDHLRWSVYALRLKS
jgi:hypothetical protein